MKRKDSLSYKRPEDIVKAFDPIATDLIKQIYSACKDKNPEKYTSIESGLVDTIERECGDERKVFKRQLNSLLACIRAVFEEDLFSQKDRIKLIKQLEEILNRTSGVFKKEFFEGINLVLNAVLQQEFNIDFPSWHEETPDAELYKELVKVLERLTAEVKENLVSAEIFNACINPSQVIIITDVEGQIKFVSEMGENLLKVKRHNLIGISIEDLLTPFDGIQAFIEDDDPDKTSVKLVPWKGVNNLVSAKMNVEKIYLKTSRVESQELARFIIKLDVHQDSSAR